MSILLAWRDAYKSGVPEIDEQHKHLFELINLLYRGILVEMPTATVEDAVDRLVDYVRSHFAFEKSLIGPFGCAACEEYGFNNDHLVARVLAFRAQYAGGDDRAGMGLLFFLQERVMEHVGTMNRCVPRFGRKVWVKSF